LPPRWDHRAAVLDHSQGPVPEQDTGQIAVTTVAGQDIGYTRMTQLQNQVAQALLADPAVDSLSSSVGVDGQNPTLSQGRMVVNLKSEGDRGNLQQVIDSLTQATSGIVGVKTYFRPVQD
jgi:multidrug efflux pump